MAGSTVITAVFADTPEKSCTARRETKIRQDVTTAFGITGTSIPIVIRSIGKITTDGEMRKLLTKKLR